MGDKSVGNPENGSIQISKIKVKPYTSIYEGKIILFYHVDSDSPKKKTKQLKAREAGVLSSILVKEGDIVQRGSELYTYKSGCSHSTVINDLCAECGFDLQKDDKISTGASVPMVHTIPSLKVSEEEARILGRADETRLINDRKLVLLVDLDQTLIHTTNDNIDPSIKDIHHFQLSGARSPWYHTRLRPGTLQFLESISKWYELHICTFGSRNYAHQIAHFLDRQGKYFSHRILSRDECFDAHSKTGNLKALFPCGDNMVCIIDDREDVWNYASNLIHVKPYHFFRHTGDINAPPGLSKTDNDFTEGYSCAQLAEGITIKQANTNKNKDKNVYQASIELLRRRKGNEEKNVMNERCEERGKDISIEKSYPTVEISAASDITSDQSLTHPQPEVHKELKVLEEKISRTNQEIVSIVKQVKSTKDDILDEESCKSAYKPSSGTAVFISEQDTNEEYVPSTVTNNEEYVPTSSVASETNNEYVPTSVTSIGSNEYMPSTTSGTNDVEKHEYTPTPMEIEYVPAGIPESIPYVPTSITETSNEQNLDSTNSNDNSRSGRDSNVQFCASSSNSIKSSHDIDACSKGNAVSNETGYKPNGNNANEENLDNEVKGLDDMDEDSSKENKGKDKSKSTGGALVISTSEQDEMKDVEEIDDYLLYLEEILKHIHEKFYITFDQLKERADSTLPDLKSIIPAIRNTVLKGVHLVFSGVVPSKMRLEENKAYSIASSLGAAVSDKIHPATTHLVAQKPGTAKVNEAKRRKNILIVTLDWLWMCAERWERVDERLFPVLPHTPASSRTPPAHCASPPYLSCPPSPPPPQFCDSINPLMTLTSEDIANMDKEVEDIFNETDDDEEEGEMKESSNDSGKRKRADSSDSSDVDSLNGDSRRRDGEEIQETQKRKIFKTKRRKKQKSKIHRDGDENSQSPDAQNKSHPLSDPSSAHRPGNDLLGTDSGLVKDNLSDNDTTSGSSNSLNDLDLSDENSDGETINSRFRRCASLPSDCEIEGKENDEDEWNLMGDMLEREFM